MTLRLRILLISVFIILAFNSLAMEAGWYHSIPWLDIPMHLIGGGWVCFLFIYLIEDWYKAEEIKNRVLLYFLLVLGFTAFIGTLWEFYEFLRDIYYIRKLGILILWSVPDTLSDLLNNLIGASTVFLSYKLIRPRKPVK